MTEFINPIKPLNLTSRPKGIYIDRTSSSMASYSGMEGRYTNRFTKLKQQTGDSIKNYDSAGNLAEHLTTAKASLKAQEKNTKDLLATAQEMIIGIDTAQQMFGHTYVKNMPLPSAAIRESPSKQLGYIQLTMRFLQAGVVHFMEQMSEATDRIEHLEKILSKLAVYDEELDLLGEMQALNLEQLEAEEKSPPTPPPESVTSPVATPTTPTRSQTLKDNTTTKKGVNSKTGTSQSKK